MGNQRSFGMRSVGQDDRKSAFGGEIRLPLPGFGKIGVFGIGLILALWLFLYISTLFPYLGHTQRSETLSPGMSTNGGIGTIGLSTMFLIEGQQAFFNYDVQSQNGGKVQFDLRPISQISATDQEKLVAGGEAGTLEFTVPATGLYNFHHDFALSGMRSTTSYSASWGAR